ncbi:WASH complex subunit 5-like [Tachypleus tridentatus]|uniref:WASH complex subunit 5-like n=1 Tax=Tachypleus tridentatus TaxID=6853 RepID=UPI003FD61045
MQLLRRQIKFELNTTCKFDSKHLASALQTMNEALLAGIEAHYKDPSKPYPKEDNPLLYELSCYLDWAGISNPLAKIYITPKPLQHLALFMFLFTVSLLPKLTYVKSLGGLVSRKGVEPVDGFPFVIGTLTFLRQFHQDNTEKYLTYIGQWVKSVVESNTGSGRGDVHVDVVSCLAFLEELKEFGEIPLKTITNYVPHYLVEEFRRL